MPGGQWGRQQRSGSKGSCCCGCQPPASLACMWGLCQRTWRAAKAAVKVPAAQDKVHCARDVQLVHAAQDGAAQQRRIREPAGSSAAYVNLQAAALHT